MNIKSAEQMRFRTSKTGIEMKYYEDIVNRVSHCLQTVWESPREAHRSVTVSCHGHGQLTEQQTHDILKEVGEELCQLGYQVSLGVDYYDEPGPLEVSWK